MYVYRSLLNVRKPGGFRLRNWGVYFPWPPFERTYKWEVSNFEMKRLCPFCYCQQYPALFPSVSPKGATGAICDFFGCSRRDRNASTSTLETRGLREPHSFSESLVQVRQRFARQDAWCTNYCPRLFAWGDPVKIRCYDTRTTIPCLSYTYQTFAKQWWEFGRLWVIAPFTSGNPFGENFTRN